MSLYIDENKDKKKKMLYTLNSSAVHSEVAESSVRAHMMLHYMFRGVF